MPHKGPRPSAVAFVLSVLLILFLGQWTELWCGDESIWSSKLVVIKRELLDVIPVVSTNEGAVGRTYSYSMTLSSKGEPYVLKRPTALLSLLDLDRKTNAQEFAAGWEEDKSRIYSQVNIARR